MAATQEVASDAGALSAAASPAGPDSSFDSAFTESLIADRAPLPRALGWRLRILVGVALAGCLAIFLLARWLAEPADIAATWRPAAQGRIELARSDDPALRANRGRTLVAVVGAAGTVYLPDSIALLPSARWIVDDGTRQRYVALQEALAVALSGDRVTLLFADGQSAELALESRGFQGLGAMFWLLCALALSLYLVSAVVVLVRPSVKNLLYAVMALCQCGNLLFIAMESTLELGLPPLVAQLDMPARMAFDLLTAAAAVNAVSLHPRRLAAGPWIAGAAWASAVVAIALMAADALPDAWSWTQAIVIALGMLTIALLSWSYRLEPHPFAVVLRRFAVLTVSTWLLLTLGVWAAAGLPGAQHPIAAVGTAIWFMFFASLLLLIPFLARSQPVLREFLLLAAISTAATSLDLLFVAVFSLGQFASLTLSLFLALGIYAGARQWILNQLLGTSMVTTERMFEQLYRVAREVEVHPERIGPLLARLLRELFEPMELTMTDKRVSSPRTLGDGSALIVPVPRLHVHETGGGRSIVLRYARRGRRLFTTDDARLTGRIVDQLRHAVAYDEAVEQGRSEERARIAQDLHDDIGARLLTLMYKASSADMEDYVRHTLQDLKTLTRGLAAGNHRLSHAAAEWKADLSQRLTAAGIGLHWNCRYDNDVLLSVVQWSALTRVLRELVSNIISHAGALHVEIDFRLEGDRLDLCVTDDGVGGDPSAWAQGLGLGGVRKRVRQLGGQVEWQPAQPNGIRCLVSVERLTAQTQR